MEYPKQQVSQNSVLNSIIWDMCVLTLETGLALYLWITKCFLAQTLFSREILPKSPVHKTGKITPINTSCACAMHGPKPSTYMALAYPHKPPCEEGTPLPPFLEGGNTGPGDSNNQPKSAAAKPAKGFLTTGLAARVLIEASMRSPEFSA